MIAAGGSPAPYLRWAKERPAARFDLAISNVVAPPPEELPGLFDGVGPNGANDDGLPAFVDGVAGLLGTTASRVAPANGASGANFLVFAALVGPGDTVLVEAPGYDPIPGSARLAGAEVRALPRRRADRWALDPDRVAAALAAAPATRVVAVSSAHNPTGVTIPPETLVRVADLCEAAGAWLLVDEVYRGGADGVPSSATGLHPRIVVTGSLTKFYGLGGLRAGWVSGERELVERVLLARDVVDGAGPYPTEMAAARALARRGGLELRARRILAENKARLEAVIAATPRLAWVPPDGGSVAILHVDGVTDSRPFVEMLLRESEVAVVPGEFFGIDGAVRVAFGGEPRMFAEAIDRFGDAVRRL